MDFREMTMPEAEWYRYCVKRDTRAALHRADLAMRGELEECDSRAVATAERQMAAMKDALVPASGSFQMDTNKLLQDQWAMSANMRHAASTGFTPASLIGGLLF